MKATNVRPPRKNGAARKRSPKPKTADSPAVVASTGAQEFAGFAPANIQPVDAEMWPVQPVIWLQPEWKPALPVASDLRIERHHKIPAPGFLNLAPEQWGGPPGPRIRYGCSSEPPATSSTLSRALPPDILLTPPESGLTLLGWDPRTVVPVGQALLPAAGFQPALPVRSSDTNAAGRFPTETKQ
jgi:hypothetical protein